MTAPQIDQGAQDPNVEHVDGTAIINILGSQLAESKIAEAVAQSRISALQEQNRSLSVQLARAEAELAQERADRVTGADGAKKAK